VADNFKSNFAYHFDVESIPRYMVFDRNGKLISEQAPRPSNVSALENILDKLLLN